MRTSFLQRLGTVISLAIAATVLSNCSTPDIPGSPLSVLVRNQSYQVNAQLPEVVRAGEAATIRLTVSRKGKPSDLKNEYRQIHAILASLDNGDIAHFGNVKTVEIGTYDITYDFPRSGQYRLWVEVDDTKNPERHGSHSDLIAFTDLEVAGKPSRPPAPVTLNETGTGNLLLHLTGSDLFAGVATSVRLNVTDASGTTLRLSGAGDAEYVLVGDNLRVFRHGPLTPSEKGDGVLLPMLLQHAGAYILWIHVQPLDGKIARTVEGSFALTVKESPANTITRK